ncbi:MAG: sulfatase [Planctomycetota bacterium]
MRLLVPALVAASLVACGERRGDDAQDAGGLTRLEVQPDILGDPEPKVIATYRPDGEAWTGPGDVPYDVVAVDGRPVATSTADGPTNVRVPADVRTTTFDRIDVDLRLPADADQLLRLTLIDGRDTFLVSELRSVRGTGSLVTESFPLDGIELHDRRPTEISVQIAGDAGRRDVAEVRVLDARPAALLPVPGTPAALIDLGSEARRGWGIDSIVGAATTIPPDADDARLHWSYARHPGAEGVELEISSDTRVQRVPLGADAPRWDEFVLDGVRGRVTFRILGAPERPSGAWTALAELQLERPIERSPAPLVLLVTSDTHRGDHLSRGGTPGLVDTPHFDALAARGVQWTNAYAPSNMTNPSHVALMTGLSPRDTRIVGNRAPLGEAAVTLAERFADAGWATAAAVSVQHIGHAYSGLGQGFDRFDGLEARADYRFGRRDGAVAVERAMRWIEERRDVPLFLWVHVFDVHGPYEAPEEFTGKYLAEEVRPVTPELDPVPSGELPPWIADDPEQRAEVTAAHARYRGAVDRLDGVLAPLIEHPRARSGVVALTGDHGEAFGRNDMWWTHHGMYRDQLHVPLIVAAPGLEPGLVVDRPAEMLDLGATLLDLAALDASEYPATPIPTGDAPSEPRYALGYSGHKASVEHEGWLLTLSLQDHDFEKGPRDFPKGTIELYHVAEDPGCAVELSEQEPDRAKRLREALVRWLASAEGDGFATAFNIDERAQAILIELGYAGNVESTRSGAWYVEDEEPR